MCYAFGFGCYKSLIMGCVSVAGLCLCDVGAFLYFLFFIRRVFSWVSWLWIRVDIGSLWIVPFYSIATELSYYYEHILRTGVRVLPS